MVVHGAGVSKAILALCFNSNSMEVAWLHLRLSFPTLLESTLHEDDDHGRDAWRRSKVVHGFLIISLHANQQP